MGSYQQQRIYSELAGTNNYSTAILGSGIVAFIAARLIPNSIIITKRHSPLFFGNVYLHDTTENRLFLKLMGVGKLQRIEVPFYYYNATTGTIDLDVSDEDRMEIIRNKMEGLNIDFSDISISTKKALDERFYILKFNELELIERLTDHTPFFEWNFDRLEFQNGKVGLRDVNGRALQFDRIINTIPQPFFQTLCPTMNGVTGNSDVLTEDIGNRRSYGVNAYNYSSVTFVTCMTDVLNFGNGGKDFMVYSYGDCTWKRILAKNGVASIEYNLPSVDSKQVFCDFPEAKIHKIVSLPYGRIASNPTLDSSAIIHVGRFAQWDHRITMEHVINKLINLNF